MGEFIAFASYNTTLVWPIRGLGRILSDMSKAGVSFERVDYIIRAEEEEYQDKKEYKKQEEPQSYDIAFSHVNYGYKDGKEVLSDVSFSIPQYTGNPGRYRQRQVHDHAAPQPVI